MRTLIISICLLLSCSLAQAEHKRVVNLKTGEIKVVELIPAEVQQRLIDKEAHEAKVVADELKEAAKQAKKSQLKDKLKLTDKEMELLFGEPQ